MNDLTNTVTFVGEAEKRRQLRRMKRIATSLFVAAAIVFVITRAMEDRAGWIGFVRATAEAAMVGAIADWFAVTALFRHPLGLPIPHTAIIPRRKEQLGRALGGFVEEHFLVGPVISEKLRSAHVANRLAAWVLAPSNATTAAGHISNALTGVAGVLGDEEVSGAIEAAILERARSLPASRSAGKVLEIATAGGHHQDLIDATIKASLRFMDENKESLRNRFSQEAPWWSPEFLDDRVYEKLFTGVRGFLTEVGQSPDHELRRYIDRRALDLTVRLGTDPDLVARGEQVKEDVLAHPAVRAWTASIWKDLKAGLQAQAGEPGSELRSQIENGLIRLGMALESDAALRGKVDRWVESVVVYVVEQERHQASELIAATVDRWDPVEAADRIETQVGRDLQFIRINGTLVGGLAGLLIHSVGQLIS